MNLDLLINEVAFNLGDRKDSDRLVAADLRPPSIWHRLVNSKYRRYSIYRASNCTLQCFGSAFDLFPCTDSYLTQDRQWRTEAEVTYAEEQLVVVRFQVVEGRYAAPNYLGRFDDLCRERFGEPGKNGDEVLEWQDAEHRLACTYQPLGHTAEFFWLMNSRIS
jgi:hypothetical protein